MSMTLAEVFLLLLFVAWYAVSSVSAGPGDVAPLRRDKERLTSELAKANERLRKLAEFERKVKYYEDILSELSVYLKKPVPTTVEELRKSFQEHDEYVRQVAKRGSPMCNRASNVLIAATVIDGAVTGKVLRDLTGEIGGDTYKAGQELTGSSLEQFLQSVSQFYRERHKREDDCRYDYRLEWATDSDYRSAREYFEQPYFYLAGITRVSASSR